MEKRYIVNWEKTEYYRTEVVAEDEKEAMDYFKMEQGDDEFIQSVMNIKYIEEAE